MKELLLSRFTALLPFVSGACVPFDDWDYQRVALKDINILFRYAGTGPAVVLVRGFPLHSVSCLGFYCARSRAKTD